MEVLCCSRSKTWSEDNVGTCRRSMSEGRAGDNVGILLRGIRRDEVERGQVRAAKQQHVLYLQGMI